MAIDDADSDQGTLPLADDWRENTGAGLPNGSLVGRYVILGQIGKGGMGVVYQAYDPELDRRIALKLLRGAALDPQARERLLAEAKAIAKLSHPNVVSAFDAGSYQQWIYIAMELVEGETLAEWLRSAPRNQRDVIEVMVAAGRGLEAAHRAGIVHRDVKPQNIIVGRDGRARVIDFGIAWQATQADSGEAAGAQIAGSPGYMPPEQCRGEPVDGTADQFAFCATLYFALFGVTAFSTESWSALQSQMDERRYNRPEKRVRVGARVEKIVLRGLSPAKADRYPSMTELLDALAANPWALPRWQQAALVAALVTTVAATIGAAIAWNTRRAQQCEGAGARFAGVWDAERRLAVQRAFVASGRPHAQSTFDRVAAALDRNVRDWVAMRTDACRATRQRGEQSEELLDLRMHCLDRVLDETRSTVKVFSTMADADVVDDAVPIVERLPSIERCANATLLKAAYPLPSDPAKVLRLEALRQRLAEVRVLERAGKYSIGLPQAKELVATAEREAYPPLEAQALGVLATLEGPTGDWAKLAHTLERTLAKAAEARDDVLLAETSIFLLYAVGQGEEHSGEALAMAPLVNALVSRASGDHPLEARRLAVLGMIKQRRGQYSDAQRDFEAALAILRRSGSETSPDIAEALNNLASAIDDQARPAEALPYYEEALRVQERTLGNDHPRVASVLNNIGLALLSLNQPVAAETHLRRALAIWLATFGPEHPEVARTYNNLGLVFAESGNLAEAKASYGRSLAIKEKLLGPNHPSVAAVLEGLGVVANRERRFADAMALCTRAQSIVEKAHGSDHPNLAYYLTCRGEAATSLGRRTEAIAWLEQALRLREKSAADARDLATTRFGLARAIGDRGDGVARARALAVQALADLEKAGAPLAKREDVQRFIAAAGR